MHEISDKFVVRKIEGETLCVPLIRKLGKKAAIFSLNETAAAILDCLRNGLAADKIHAHLKESYPEVSPVKLKKDIAEAINDLKSIGIIK